MALINCVFCDKITERKIVLFNNKTLKKCQEMLMIRRLNRLKYSEVVLPTEPNDTCGYHAYCYRPFSAIQKKYYDRTYPERSSALFENVQMAQPFTSTGNIQLYLSERETKMITEGVAINEVDINPQISFEEIESTSLAEPQNFHRIKEEDTSSPISFEDTMPLVSDVDRERLILFEGTESLNLAQPDGVGTALLKNVQMLQPSTSTGNMQLYLSERETEMLTEADAINEVDIKPEITIEETETTSLAEPQDFLRIKEEDTNSPISNEDTMPLVSDEDRKQLILYEDTESINLAQPEGVGRIMKPLNSFEDIDPINMDRPKLTKRIRTSLNIKCVFCGIKTDERIILFNGKSLNKCKEFLNIRRIYGLKYSEIVLPIEPNDASGYHTDCYKPFSAISKKYYDRMMQHFYAHSEKMEATQLSNSNLIERNQTDQIVFEDTESISLDQPQKASEISEEDSKPILIEEPEEVNRIIQTPMSFEDIESISMTQSEGSNRIMTSLNIKCIFCGIKTMERIILFNENSLKRCKKLLNIRRVNGLKYSELVLPTEPNDTCGYHRHCYKPFSAINKKYYDRMFTRHPSILSKKLQAVQSSTSTGNIKLHLTGRRTKAFTKTSVISECAKPQTSSELEGLSQPEKLNVCFFCNKNRKIYQREIQVLQYCYKDNFIASIKNYITTEQQASILNRLQNKNIVFYHNICVQNFYSNKKMADRKIKKLPHKQHLNKAYADLCEFIHENIINRNNCYFFSYLQRYYLDCLQEAVERNSEQFDHTFTAPHLETQIRKTFEGHIKLITKHNKKIVLPQLIVTVDDKSYSLLEESETMQKAAWVLRKSILEMESNNLSENLVKLESSVPNQLIEFLTILLEGSGSGCREDSNCQQKVISLSQEITYAVKNFKDTRYESTDFASNGGAVTNEGILQDPLAIVENANNDL